MLLAAAMNTIYVYADFSGYSDMACGISKGLGIRITNNFAFPFFATNISEFWKRWHISLTTWIMTYVYTPISFILRRQKKMGTFIAIFSAFIIVGIWHGLKSGFFVYGCLQALFFLPLVLKGGNMNSAAGSNASTIATFVRMAALFLLVCVTALFVREIPASQSLKEITLLITRATQTPDLSGVLGVTNAICWALIATCFGIEWLNRKQDHGLNIQRLSAPVRWSFYIFVILSIFFFSEFPGGGFIYAQF
jgi:D-alanyl-lipoteichoic acid acyltransferase DltB (MBOAT superfamily)